MVGGGDDSDGATEGGHREMSRGVPGCERRSGVTIGGCPLLTFWMTLLAF